MRCDVVWCGALLGAVWCGALLFAIRCGYTILQVVLVRFSEHSYFLLFGYYLVPPFPSSFFSLYIVSFINNMQAFLSISIFI